MLLVPIAVLCLVSQGTELQPRTVESPSGRWSLHVEPRTRSGTGAAVYTMHEGGKLRWERKHPFALWDAVVTDDGRTAGYAFVGASREAWSGGEVSVVLLSPEGEVLLHETHERAWSRFPHEPADPLPVGVFAQPELGRFVVRVRDEDINRRAESWWAYALEDGASLSRKRPRLDFDLGVDRSARSVVGARGIPGTPLVLVHWYRFETSEKPWERGALFQLVDAAGEVVWDLTLPHDYENPDDEAAEYALLERIGREGAILSTGAGTFDLWHARPDERVSYGVARAPDGTWTVEETARAPRGSRDDAKPGRTLTLKLSRDVPLVDTAASRPDIHDVLAFAVEPDGRIRFARQEPDGTSLVWLDRRGVVLRDVQVPQAALGGEWVEWFPIAAPRWIAVEHRYEEGPAHRAWLVDQEAGEVEPLLGPNWKDVQRVEPLGEEGFVVQSGAELVSAHSLDGERLWQYPLCPKDMTVTTDGTVVLLDVIRRELRIVSSDGVHVRTIDLEESWGKKPNYPSGIHVAPDGGVLVQDFNGAPALWRMTLEGEVLQSFDATTAEGIESAEYRRTARYAPDGTLWATDGHVLVRLDDEGHAVETFGPPPDVDKLGSVETAVVDSASGRIVLQDRRTRAFHVLDGEGERVSVHAPTPESFPDLRSPLEVHLAPGGALWTAESRYDRTHHRFGSGGEDLGPEKLLACNVGFVADGYWGVRKLAIVRVRDGRVVHELEKNADGCWWRDIEDVAVAADGSLAVLDMGTSPNRFSRPEGFPFVALIGADGSQGALHELPLGSYRELAYTPPWVVVTGWDAADRAEGMRLLDVRDGRLRKIDLGPTVALEEVWSVGFSPNGDELWVVGFPEPRLLRFALPAGEDLEGR